MSPGRQISAEFWVFNISDASPILEIKNGATTMVTVTVSGGDYVLTWASTSTASTFTGMATNTPVGTWSMIGVSVGWDGTTGNNGGMACMYTFGASEVSNCFYNLTINLATDLSTSASYNFEFLKGSTGTVSEVYVEEYFKVPEEFKKFSS